ncbi:MAG TPA: S8 family serine peptidase [Gemmatimonadaceae bacterium]|jgi:subtilisin|nr:S8 family serine peptidase [Gemmatimonadaceae bacterium]
MTMARPSMSETPVRVGVIDSGWDASVPDRRVEPGVGFVATHAAGGISMVRDAQDRHGHGTACADLILQVAPEARIVPIRIFSERLEASPAALIAAIDWAVARHLGLINLSLTTIRRDALAPLYRSCELARRAGTIVVAAAGPINARSLPSIFEPVIGVTAGRFDNRLEVQYRDRHEVECVANGVQRARSLAGRVRTWSGSSFAAPVVTGHIANFLQSHLGATIEVVRQMLVSRFGYAGASPLSPVAQ